MTTRPDLDAARGLLYRVAQHPAYLDIPRELVEELASEAALLLTYCRELEEENKRLQRRDLDIDPPEGLSPAYRRGS